MPYITPWQWKVLVQPYSKDGPTLNRVCASQMHLCITNGWRPAQLNKALSGNRMTLSLVNILVSLNNADCHLLLILLFSLSPSLSLYPSASTLCECLSLPMYLSFHPPIIFHLISTPPLQSPRLSAPPSISVSSVLPFSCPPYIDLRILTTSEKSRWFWRSGSSASLLWSTLTNNWVNSTLTGKGLNLQNWVIRLSWLCTSIAQCVCACACVCVCVCTWYM